MKYSQIIRIYCYSQIVSIAIYCIKPKYAYKVITTENAPAGSINDMFTQSWESMVVPTSNTIEMQSNQHNDINIGVWKDKTTGERKNSLAGKNAQTREGTAYGSTSRGNVYGNGTSTTILLCSQYF